jgi:hypothetical protein
VANEELVARLRPQNDDRQYIREAKEALQTDAVADRIEALTAKHEELYGVFVFWRAEADKLREQLEAASADTAALLADLEEAKKGLLEIHRIVPLHPAGDIALATLKKLKDETSRND